MLAWDWLYEWMIKQAAQAGFYMTSSPNITGFFYNSEERFVKWSEETINRKGIYFPLKHSINCCFHQNYIWQLLRKNKIIRELTDYD